MLPAEKIIRRKVWEKIYAKEFFRLYKKEVIEEGKEHNPERWADEAAALADMAVEKIPTPFYLT